MVGLVYFKGLLIKNVFLVIPRKKRDRTQNSDVGKANLYRISLTDNRIWPNRDENAIPNEANVKFIQGNNL